MILEKGDMWSVYGKTDLFCITTNSIIKNNGELVMGRGIALEAKNRFPLIPLAAARVINKNKKYGLRILFPEYYGADKDQIIGLFQVKYNWKDKADLDLINYSTNELIDFTNDQLYYQSDLRIDLNFPGIGNGRLNRNKVLPIIEKLPDSVHVWEK